jgi:hypothetical protein
MTDEQAPARGQRERAADATTSRRPELAQAWALIGIFDELKTIRQEMHRQARAGTRRG